MQNIRFVLAGVLLLGTLLVPLLSAQVGWLFRPSYFEPSSKLSGLGVSRTEMSDDVLARRTELMIESQTFGIMRDPQALAGAQRVTTPALKKLFDAASAQTGLPSNFIAAIAFLESWGNAKAQSPTGPKGIMQIAQGTARTMGLRVSYAKRYRTVVQRRKVRTKKGVVTRSVRRRVPYTVVARDERMIPSIAIPVAARYLARLEQKFGGRDWAVWAYHCGEGCTSRILELAANAEGLRKPLTVAGVFFGAHPARNRELHQALQYHMSRDFSPTYWFRIMRAQQLLELYQKDPVAFRRLHAEYRNQADPVKRAPHRLSVWLKPEDLAYKNCEDLRREQGRSLVRAFDEPRYYGFELSPSIWSHDPVNRDYYVQASPAAMGTIAYVAYETRRLHNAMKVRGEQYQPLEISALVLPRDEEEKRNGDAEEPLSHCSGQVFDINYAKLPPGQREALDFVLDDLGWHGYLGFVRHSVSTSTYHIGASPAAREFFAGVYRDALNESRDSD